MDQFSFVISISYVINSIARMNSNKYEYYINKNPHYQFYFYALCELYDILDLEPEIHNHFFINDYHILYLKRDYFHIRKYCFTHNIENLLILHRLPDCFNNNHLEIFTYYENIISKRYKEERIEDERINEEKEASTVEEFINHG